MMFDKVMLIMFALGVQYLINLLDVRFVNNYVDFLVVRLLGCVKHY